MRTRNNSAEKAMN